MVMIRIIYSFFYLGSKFCLVFKEFLREKIPGDEQMFNGDIFQAFGVMTENDLTFMQEENERRTRR